MNSYTVRRANFSTTGTIWPILVIVDADHPVQALESVIGTNWKIQHSPPNPNLGDDQDKDRDRYVVSWAEQSEESEPNAVVDWFRVTITS